MGTTYEVRRDRHVVTTKDDAPTALAFAQLHSHFPGQLSVWGVERREYLVTDPSKVVTLDAGRRAGNRGR